MNAIHDDLLAVAHEFYFLPGVTICRDKSDGNLLERLCCLKQHHALGAQAEANQQAAGVAKTIAD